MQGVALHHNMYANRAKESEAKVRTSGYGPERVANERAYAVEEGALQCITKYPCGITVHDSSAYTPAAPLSLVLTHVQTASTGSDSSTVMMRKPVRTSPIPILPSPPAHAGAYSLPSRAKNERHLAPSRAILILYIPL